MKKRAGLLPRLAVMGIRKNGSTYLPYIGVSIFAVFTYFVFDIILKSDITRTVPRAEYAIVLLSVGFGLLGLIMLPFLYYTNSFLIKRRKRELGLYSILGLEKKHIGIMMTMETLILYGIISVSAMALGLLFSRLIFLALLNLAKIPINVELNISPQAVVDTLVFYAVISGINLFTNLVQVGKTNPVELMSESRKGEKEPKHIWIWTVLGVLCLGCGYWLALKAKVNSMIFMNFFFAVFLVVVGTYFLFTSGSIFFLRLLKKNKRFYYRPSNFVTVSGMLYRMKKNAASLVNICVFATMVIITVACTVSLYLGIPGMKAFVFPFDVEVNFGSADFLSDYTAERWKKESEAAAAENGVQIVQYQEYPYTLIHTVKEGDSFLPQSSDFVDYEKGYQMRLLTLEAFNRLEGESRALEPGEALLYSTGPDYGLDRITLGEDTLSIREEFKESRILPKAENNEFGGEFVVVLADGEAVARAAAAYGVDSRTNGTYRVEVKLEGTKEQIQAFSQEWNQMASGAPGFRNYRCMVQPRDDMDSMYGGLLFIGIFYGLIFMTCLLIIMYYKQITEGFEDQKSFEIMQEVGMGDQEVRSTIKKQILMVFFVPLIGAVCHTAVGTHMVIKLFGTISFFQSLLIIGSVAGVCLLFSILYGVCYNRTAKTYYRIVKKMA